jgi:hypothetical protein
MIRKGSDIQWKWGEGHATGTVQETFSREIIRTINGNEVTRKGKKNNKALLIKQEDGQRVLKLESEVKKA